MNTNKKNILIISFIIFFIIAFSINEVSWNTANYLENKSSAELLGNKSYGWAGKDFYGNLKSNETIALITGVHPRESGFHNAISAALKDKSSSLSKKYIRYNVHVTKSPSHFTIGRMNGQLVANKLVVPIL